MNAPESGVRLARADDAAAIATIYNEGIADRVATFETEPRTPEQIARQLADRGDRYPTVVVDRGGQVVAWAGAGPYRNRPAYAGVAEHSVYVARDARGTGAGRAALEGLIRAYAATRVLEDRVPHLSGEHHEHSTPRACGFRLVGVYRRHGKLEDEWRDCVIVERLLEDDRSTER